MPDIGYVALSMAFVLAAYAAVASLLAVRSGQGDLWLSARNAVWAALALTSVASVALVYALATRDFSLRYVAEYTSRDLSMPLTLSAWWAGQAGSLLFWSWLLAVFAGVVLIQNRRQNKELTPYTIAVIMAVLTFFLGIVIFAANPFEKLPVTPADGLGLNPLLQNKGMLYHPPTLYLGYVAFTVPYAYAMAALLSGRLGGNEWIHASRRWALFAWLFLGAGNLLGAQWAYTVLGWGGFWGWDPVENAGLMPWLTGTAFLHSLVVQQRRGMLKVWNLALIITTFSLCLFGTAVTRGGILSSVHAFSTGLLGWALVGLMVAVLLTSLWLLWKRMPELRSEHELDSFVSKESGFLFNNLILVGAAFAIFCGTTFPWLSKAVQAGSITVEPSFYNRVTGPIFLAMIVLMGLCPLIGWRKAPRGNLVRNALIPLAAALTVAALLYGQGVRSPPALLAFPSMVFVAVASLQEFYRGVRARRRSHRDGLLLGLPRLVWSNKPRYGGQIVHLGIILVAMGVASYFMYSTSAGGVLAPGESLSVGGYELTFNGLDVRSTETQDIAAANLAVSRNGEPDGTVAPEGVLFRSQQSVVTNVGLRSGLREDLYVVLNGVGEDGRVSIQAFVNPLVAWIWIGGGVMLAGTAIAFWPDRRERRRVLRLPEMEIRTLEASRA
jgi:cytochrome c-type biogenesis protein CcmF